MQSNVLSSGSWCPGEYHRDDSPHDILREYIRSVNALASLSAQEEEFMCTRWVSAQDITAAQNLVKSHLKLVVKIAFKFKGYGFAMMEVICEGNLGLMRAVQSFNPSFGFRLSSYATQCIKVSIQEFILRSWSMVKIATSTAQRKIFFGLSKAKRAVAKMLGINKSEVDESHSCLLATSLAVKEGEVVSMQRRMSASAVDISEIPETELLGENPVDPERQCFIKMRNRALGIAFDSLNERQKMVMRSVMGHRTLREIAATLGVSIQRVDQIKKQAVEKIREYLSIHFGYQEQIQI